jgi:hypothetical protein
MIHLHNNRVVSAVEEQLGRPLAGFEHDCVTNVIEGYNAGEEGRELIKQSIRKGARGLLTIGEDDPLLRILDVTEEVCDALFRKATLESN